MKKLSNILSLSSDRIRNRYRRRSSYNSNNSINSNNNSNNNNNNNNNNYRDNNNDDITSDNSSDTSSNSSILHRTVKNAHHSTKYSDSEHSIDNDGDSDSDSSSNKEDENNIKLKKLKKLSNLKGIDLDLLLQDEIYDQVEDDVLDTLLNYTTEEDLNKFRKYLIKKQKRKSKIQPSKEEEREEEEEESTSEYSTTSSELNDREEEYYEDDFGVHEYSSDYELNKNDIESNRQVLRDSLTNSVLKRKRSRKSISLPSLSPPLSPRIEPTTPSSPVSPVSPLSTSSTSSTSSSSTSSTSSSVKMKNLKESIKAKAILYLKPPKLLMQMDDVEMINEDICAIDRSLAGYVRTGLSITALGIALLQRLGATTKTLIVSIIFFAYGLSLIIIGLRRNRVIANYLIKGYMKPSIISVSLVTIFTIIIAGISYYAIV